MRQPAVYLLANRPYGTLYVGVTSDLIRRVHQHRTDATGFVSRYGCIMLVWHEQHASMTAAIAREKQIKGGSRAKKLGLIRAANPAWRDLWADITEYGSQDGLLRFARNDG